MSTPKDLYDIDTFLARREMKLMVSFYSKRSSDFSDIIKPGDNSFQLYPMYNKEIFYHSIPEYTQFVCDSLVSIS